jgi:hypothetical protein
VCRGGGWGTHFRSWKMLLKSTAFDCKHSFKQSYVKPLSCEPKCNKFMGFKRTDVYAAFNDFAQRQVHPVFIAEINIAPYYTAGQLRPTGGPHSSLRTRLRAAVLYSYIESGRGDLFNYKTVIYKRVTLKVRLNEKAVGRTELHKTQIIVGLQFSCSTGILSAIGRIIILRRVCFRKCEIIICVTVEV